MTKVEEFNKFVKLIREYEFWEMRIPIYMSEPLAQYLVYHWPVGSFLKAVLCNDLIEAVSRADDNNILVLPAYVGFLHNNVDGAVWGSSERYNNWTAEDKRILRSTREA